MTDGFYSVPEFLNAYSLPRTTFYRIVQRGQLRIHKLGRASRVSRADAKAWADSLPTIGGKGDAQ